MGTTEELDGRSHWLTAQATPGRVTHGLRRRAGVTLVASVVMSVMLWTDGGVAVAGTSFDAREVVTRGTIEAGVATGFWQATTVVGNGPSANRSAVFVLPRVGMVLTDPLGTG